MALGRLGRREPRKPIYTGRGKSEKHIYVALGRPESAKPIYTTLWMAITQLRTSGLFFVLYVPRTLI